MAVTVGVRELRNNFRSYLDRVKRGEDVIVTERGKPIARITQAQARSKRDELIARGVITPSTRPWRPPLTLRDLPTATEPLSEEVTRQRGPD